ncbi:MAG: hypothetical protein ACXWP5_08665, partial [Bdellovibrionota bacterium]
MGAAFPVWPDLSKLTKIWGPRDFRGTFHHYVSADPTVDVSGTKLPMTTDLNELVVNFDRLAEAVLQASRSKTGSIRKRGSSARRVSAKLAHRLGGRNLNVL